MEVVGVRAVLIDSALRYLDAHRVRVRGAGCLARRSEDGITYLGIDGRVHGVRDDLDIIIDLECVGRLGLRLERPEVL